MAKRCVNCKAPFQKGERVLVVDRQPYCDRCSWPFRMGG